LPIASTPPDGGRWRPTGELHAVYAIAGTGIARMVVLGSTMTQNSDDHDAGDNELVIALTSVQIGVVAAITIAIIIWFVARRKRWA